MLLPQAPDWFRGLLRKENPSLRVAHLGGPGGWRISQLIPYVRHYGRWEGLHISRVEYRLEKVLDTPGLGSGILQDLKRHWVPNYRDFDDFVKKMNIQTDR